MGGKEGDVQEKGDMRGGVGVCERGKCTCMCEGVNKVCVCVRVCMCVCEMCECKGVHVRGWGMYA